MRWSTVPPSHGRRAVTRTRGRQAQVLLATVLLGLALVALSGAGHAETRSPWSRAEPGPEPDYPDVTVTADWLARRLDARDVVIIDARPAASYLAGHVLGAVSFPAKSISDVEFPPELEGLPPLLGEMGLTGRELLVCCGDVSYSREAAWLFWLLEVAGASRVVVLDEGVEGWRAAGRELVSADVRRPPATWTREPDPELLATREVRQALLRRTRC